MSARRKVYVDSCYKHGKLAARIAVGVPLLSVAERGVHGAAHLDADLRARLFVIVLCVDELRLVIRQPLLHRLRVQLLLEAPVLRRRMKNELNFPPNFEGLVLGCIDADFCK